MGDLILLPRIIPDVSRQQPIAIVVLSKQPKVPTDGPHRRRGQITFRDQITVKRYPGESSLIKNLNFINRDLLLESKFIRKSIKSLGFRQRHIVSV